MAATTADPAVEEGRWEARLHPMRTWRAVGDAGGDTEEDVVREVPPPYPIHGGHHRMPPSSLPATPALRLPPPPFLYPRHAAPPNRWQPPKAPHCRPHHRMPLLRFRKHNW
ncbi:Os11g0123950 [Oryza sativa Japonica Group]|uniref:Os11g0123950 protein n=2 Tax=Oryza sativa subsp. japonica TaxID=39947 RepID=B9G949_ORYSJ|nr:hypothetical protein OsJ_32768 [Oryza sativa Japonica Group]BAT12469.1 Os11g0123950 [Oryza sativa Japonica Group]